MSDRLRSVPDAAAHPMSSAAGGAGAEPGTARPGRVALALFLFSLIVYNANLQGRPFADSIPSSILPLAILIDRTATLDRYFEALGESAASIERRQREYSREQSHYYVTPKDGRIHSSYPLALPVLITPLYAPVVWALSASAWPTRSLWALAGVMEPIAASVIAALSVALMYLLLARLAPSRWALALTIAFAFGTSTWATSSQALWQHGASTLFLILTLFWLERHPLKPWLGGSAAAAAIAIRPPMLMLWVAVLLVMLHERRGIRVLAGFAWPGLITGLALAGYNFWLFGDVRGYYESEPFQSSLVTALAGVLVSPSRGLLIYSPVVLLGVLGLVVHLRSRPIAQAAVFRVARLYVLFHLLTVAGLSRWWGGSSFGPRLMTEAAAALVILAVPAVIAFRNRRVIAYGFAAALAFSMAVQGAGAFCRVEVPWESVPASIDEDPSRLWDWRENELRWTVRNCR